MVDLVVIGAGGFGRETLDVIEAINHHGYSLSFNILGVVDDRPSMSNIERLRNRGYSWLGTIAENKELLREVKIAVAIGNPQTRRQVVVSLSTDPYSYPTLIHPNAIVGSEFLCAHGVIICAAAVISTNVSIDQFVHVNPGAVIGHDAHLQQFVSVNPSATISGEVTVGAESLIGANATVLQNLTIGERATVGAAACVTKNVPSGATAVGVPARWE